ncbi:hypothetical protein [Streptomyces sp. RPT161]|uniref:hypothetical protein n=1 Tax=Streptomyces sp. RPT161 TaxID=3015993 RepID=UPI0022B8CC1E|nr:hypothetical protein [Streptomyces sp. RPT161]
MHTSPEHRPWHQAAGTINGLRSWTARRRRAATAQLMRGAFYSLGSGIVSLFILWIQHQRW